MKKRQRKAAMRAYAAPHVQLTDLECEAPLLANSVDEMQGTTDPVNQGGGIRLEDFQDGGNVVIP